MTHSDEGKIEISVPLLVDQNGFFGRECPQEKCKKYFKVLPGTGLKETDHCICPYCGYKGSNPEFFTPDQIKRVHTAAMNVAYDKVKQMLGRWNDGLKPRGRYGMDIAMRIKDGAPQQLHIYSEKDLETTVECNNCTLKYSVYGVFAFCPDCGQHNSQQIFYKDLEVIGRSLDIAESSEKEIRELMIEAAVDKCVSSFDGFGRELCRLVSDKTRQDSGKSTFSFQNLTGANTNFQKLSGAELKTGIHDDEWQILVLNFQKRHLFAHKKGVIDQEYIDKTGDYSAVVGRKVSLSIEEIRRIIPILRNLADYMLRSIPKQMCGEIQVEGKES